MSGTKYIYLTGVAKWAKVKRPDDKYGHFTLNLYLDEPSMDKYKDSGLQLEVKSDEDGDFIRPRRNPSQKIKDEIVEFGPPKVLLYDKETEAYVPFDGLVGNGSLVTCKIATFSTQRGPGHRLEAVAVEHLVPFEDGSEEMPF